MDALSDLPATSVDALVDSGAPVLEKPRRRRILPGFGLALGVTIFWLSAIVLIPLGALVLKCVTPTSEYPTVSAVLGHVWAAATSEEALSTYKISFGLAFAAALLNGVFGFLAAWALTRYTFFGRRAIDALIDLPLAMPTSVAGLALTQIFDKNHGVIGEWLFRTFGWQVVNTPWGILIALMFVGFPFVVRTLQPVIASLTAEVEEAAACLGANRVQTFRRVILPALRPALLTGAMLAFGRGVGEYGSIVFIVGMKPFYTEITPQLIILKLEEYDYVGAAGIGLTMLLFSFAIVGTVNLIQSFGRGQGRRG